MDVIAEFVSVKILSFVGSNYVIINKANLLALAGRVDARRKRTLTLDFYRFEIGTTEPGVRV